MTQLYFHCTNARKVLVDHYGAVPKIGAVGSCTSTMTSAQSSSLPPSLLCSANPVSDRHAFVRIPSRSFYSSSQPAGLQDRRQGPMLAL
jgi:hypothetical protein